MGWQIDSQIVEVLVAVDRGIFGLSFGEVEHPLELSVVGVVLFVSHCYEVQVSSSLV